MIIFVPGHVLKKMFENKVALGNSLQLSVPQGPYSYPQFMAHVAEHQRASEMQLNKLVESTNSDRLEEIKITEVAKVTAKGARSVAAANQALSMRLMEVENTPDLVAKMAKQGLVAAARKLKEKEEQEAEQLIELTTHKWDNLIAQRIEIEAKVAARKISEQQKKDKAVKRARDLAEQATTRVQRDILKNAAKRVRTEEEDEVQSGDNGGGETAAAGGGADGAFSAAADEI